MNNPEPLPANPSRCPLCGGDNDCQLCSPVGHKGPCWCVAVQIPDALLERIPPELRHRACLCRDCVAKWQLEK